MLFSTFKSICFSPSLAPPAQVLLERAAAAFPGPTTRSRPFGSAYCAADSLVLPPLLLSVVLLLVRRTRARGMGGESGTTVALFGTIWATPGYRGSAPLPRTAGRLLWPAVRTNCMFAA